MERPTFLRLRQGSFAGRKLPSGVAGWQGPGGVEAPLGFADNRLHCFPRGLRCHDFPNKDAILLNQGAQYPERSWFKHHRTVLLKFFFFFLTSIWVHFLWSMATVYSHVLETIRRQLLFHKQ